MVTPVHRFQSIESVATGGTRHHNRGPSYQNRLPIHYGPSTHHASTSRNPSNVSHSMELLRTSGQPHQNSATPRHSGTSISRLKCVVWAFFAIATFFIAGAKYYFHGGNMGMEAIVFCSLLGIILFIGGVISLYDAVVNTPIGNNEAPPQPLSVQVSNEPQEPAVDVAVNQVPNDVVRVEQLNELPPPPYHIAIMLPSQAQQRANNNVPIVSDSPPPSYEKVVT